MCLSLFCYKLLCVHSSFVIILKRKRKLVALLLLSDRCIVTIKNDLWVGLYCVIVQFPDHTHLLFATCKTPFFLRRDPYSISVHLHSLLWRKCTFVFLCTSTWKGRFRRQYSLPH